jgi:hypothetical protein
VRLSRLAAVLLAALLVAGCGGDEVDPDTARLREADAALRQAPGDQYAMAEVIRVAAAGAGRRVDSEAGGYEPGARPFLERAAEVWPRYVRATRRHPNVSISSLMVGVYGNGLKRPRDAARAAELVAQERPTAAAYLSLADWSSRAGERRKAVLAAQNALELASPDERARVRAAIRHFTEHSG